MHDFSAFQKKVLAFYKTQGRDLPWRKAHDPYRILVSEIMLQQTQVTRVLERFDLFVKKFPDFKSLAQADKNEVLIEWQGMGYNRRALYLWRIAQIVMDERGGVLPQTVEELDDLPGIGYNTACSIAAFAYNLPTVFIETNIRTVFLHEFFPNEENIDDKVILELVQKTLDTKNPRDWYYALMDYGTMLKKKMVNPSRRSKHYKKQSKFAGSDRQVRGEALRFILKNKKTSKEKITQHLVAKLSIKKDRARKIIMQLQKEGFPLG